MPQTVRVEGGQTDEVITADQMRIGEIAILVAGSGGRAPDRLKIVCKANGELGFPDNGTWASDLSQYKVRRLRPGEKIVIEG